MWSQGPIPLRPAPVSPAAWHWVGSEEPKLASDQTQQHLSSRLQSCWGHGLRDSGLSPLCRLLHLQLKPPPPLLLSSTAQRPGHGRNPRVLLYGQQSSSLRPLLDCIPPSWVYSFFNRGPSTGSAGYQLPLPALQHCLQSHELPLFSHNCRKSWFPFIAT